MFPLPEAVKKRQGWLGFDLKHISAGQGCGDGFSPILVFIVVFFVWGFFLFFFLFPPFPLFLFPCKRRYGLRLQRCCKGEAEDRLRHVRPEPCSTGKALASPRHAAAGAFAGLMNNACVEWLGSSAAPSLQRIGISCYCRLGCFFF